MALESKKQKRKRARRQSRQLVKSWFNAHIGYVFIGTFQYIKQYFKKSWVSLTFITLSICFVIAMFFLIPGNQQAHQTIHKHQSGVNKLQAQLKDAKEDDSDLTKELANISEKQSDVIHNADDLIRNVMSDMYDYRDQDEYDKNRKDAKQYFKDEKLPKLYSNGYDSDGDPMIDNMDLKSSLDKVRTFNVDKDNNSSDKLKLKTMVQYSAQTESSNSHASHKHYIIYDIQVDAGENKITDIKKNKKLTRELKVG